MHRPNASRVEWSLCAKYGNSMATSTLLSDFQFCVVVAECHGWPNRQNAKRGEEEKKQKS